MHRLKRHSVKNMGNGIFRLCFMGFNQPNVDTGGDRNNKALK